MLRVVDMETILQALRRIADGLWVVICDVWESAYAWRADIGFGFWILQLMLLGFGVEGFRIDFQGARVAALVMDGFGMMTLGFGTFGQRISVCRLVLSAR